MAIQFDWSQVGQGALDSLPPQVSGAVETAKDFACGLYRNYDRWFGNIAPIDATGGAVRGLWEKICGPENLPPPATNPNGNPISGSDCACAGYVLQLGRRVPGNAPELLTGVTVLGPIYGIESELGASGGISHYVRHGLCSGGSLTGTQRTIFSFGPVGTECWLISATRSNPAAPCQAPAPQGGPIQPPAPSDQIQYRPLPAPGGLSVNVPVILIKPIAIANIAVEVNVQVGPINVEFSLGGVTINIGGGGQAPPWRLPQPPAPELPPGNDRPSPPPDEIGGGFDTINEKLDEVIEALEDVKDCACPPSPPFQVQQLGSGTGGVFNLPARTVFVRLVLTVLSGNAKIEFGNENSPDVYYAGWYSFGSAIAQGERKPISFQLNEYPWEEGCTTFNFNLRAGYEASVFALIEPELE